MDIKIKIGDKVEALIDFRDFGRGSKYTVDSIQDKKWLCFKKDLNKHGFYDVTYDAEYFKITK